MRLVARIDKPHLNLPKTCSNLPKELNEIMEVQAGFKAVESRQGNRLGQLWEVQDFKQVLKIRRCVIASGRRHDQAILFASPIIEIISVSHSLELGIIIALVHLLLGINQWNQ